MNGSEDSRRWGGSREEPMENNGNPDGGEVEGG